MKFHYSKIQLKNGIRVLTSPMRETAAAMVRIYFGAGARHETQEQNGIAHFLEHMAFKGTKKRPTTLDIVKELDRYSGSYNASTGYETTSYYIHLPARKLDVALDIFSDMLLNSKFDAKEIEKEKGPILEELKHTHDDHGSFLGYRMQELLYGDSPLGREIVGTEKLLKEMDREKILGFYNQFYNPDNIVVAVAGNFDEAKTQKLISKLFTPLTGKTTDKFERIIPIQTAPQVKLYKRDMQQVRLSMTFRSFGRHHTPESDLYARWLLSDILGGFMSSRLFIQVREKRGLCYSIGSSQGSYDELGEFEIGGGFDPANTKKALEVIFAILRDIKRKGFTPDELAMAKENNIGGLELAQEGPGYISNLLARDELHFGKIRTPDETIANIKKVTNKDLMRVANQIFTPENCNMVLVGAVKEKEESEYASLIKL
ncbi:MAG: pitrilysin family protein [Patescibacteria group bacterium]